MKKELGSISLHDFIEVAAGNFSVLVEDGEQIGEQELKSAAADVIYSYRCIVSPSSVRSELYDNEEVVKMKSRMMLVRILKALYSIGNDVSVRQFLEEMSERIPADGDIPSKLDRIYSESQFRIKRIYDCRSTDTGKSESVQIRESFDSEIAFINSYYRMCVDPYIVSAGVFANMVRHADIEIQSRKNRR